MSEVEKKLEEFLDGSESSGGSGKGRVSMRELNQQTRSVIDRVQSEGTALTITDRGKPVAEIRPIGEKTGLDKLEEMGVLVQRGRPLDITWEPVEIPGFSLEKYLEWSRNEWMDEALEREV